MMQSRILIAEVACLNGRYQACISLPGGHPVCMAPADSREAAWSDLHDAIAQFAGSRPIRIGSSPDTPHQRTYTIGGGDD